ncbi:hypothetical protein F8388_025794 [Cannabis sativa]|uniref:Uncharacterized protein n=1 Tax=Cannabis sativa TaxID=3483 RepID=A0A7J6F9M5_CANSA|nr:hypothetical protein F8388_025794 [Cannabis sativa]
MNNLSHHQPHHNHTELHSRATSSSRSKWNELEVSTYGNLSKSDSSTILSMPTVVSSSFCSFFIAVGCLMSCDIAHSTTVDAVSIEDQTLRRSTSSRTPFDNSYRAQIDCNPAITRSSIVFYELDKMTNLFSSHRSKSAYLETT